ncbi:MAG: NUDIX domain-containing protein [Solirubrobacteraceae bacterium]
MQAQPERCDVGVIVGRFQVPELHDAHRELIAGVCDAHDKVLIFLGLAPVLGTRSNPLDFEARKQMLLEAFPQVNVHHIEDVQDDVRWSRTLDHLVDRLTTPAQTAVLYGSRESFSDRYEGALPVVELAPSAPVSATEIRDDVKRRSTVPSADFRAGAVWSALAQYPTCLPTVDVAIFNEDETEVLLGRKPDETGYRFIGGFAEPSSPSYEADARREAQEETGLSITDPVYLGSLLVDDWRVRDEAERAIKTIFFKARVLDGAPAAADDIAEVRWFDRATLTDAQITPTHRPLLAVLEDKG